MFMILMTQEDIVSDCIEKVRFKTLNGHWRGF